MRLRQFHIVFPAIFAFVALPASAATDVVTSKGRACTVLKRAAVTFHLSRQNLSGRYYCDSLGDTPQFYLMGLRYRLAKDESVGSNLIGWFAVRRSDGAVLDWDINSDGASPLAPRPPFEP
jgi:hypothetical protein